jgi:thioredoxin-related protein
MKQLIYLAIISFAITAIPLKSFPQQEQAAAKIKWYDFSKAIDLNDKKPKKIFIDMYTDWCGWCKRMDQTTFQNPVIVEYMNKNFYAVKFNAERKDTVTFGGKTFVNPNPAQQRSAHQLAQSFLQGRMSYPSFVLLNEKNEVITVLPGYRKASEFEAILHYIGEDAYKTMKWEEFRPTFKGTAKDE